jgi:hypothetical protein
VRHLRPAAQDPCAKHVYRAQTAEDLGETDGPTKFLAELLETTGEHAHVREVLSADADEIPATPDFRSPSTGVSGGKEEEEALKEQNEGSHLFLTLAGEEDGTDVDDGDVSVRVRRPRA